MTQLNPFNHLTLWADFQQAAYDAMDAAIEVDTIDGPGPGDVYREYAVHAGGNLDWRVTDPRATASGAWKFLPNPTLELTIDDLEHAIRAEAVIDRWGGHLKTTDKRIPLQRQYMAACPGTDDSPDGPGGVLLLAGQSKNRDPTRTSP